MSRRKAMMIVLAAGAVGTVYQIGGCIGQTILQLAGVALLDIFVSPLLGDTCTWLDQSGC